MRIVARGSDVWAVRSLSGKRGVLGGMGRDTISIDIGVLLRQRAKAAE